eukprot:gene43044-53809_t
MSLYMDRIPATWQKRAWPSMRGLSSWLSDFNARLTQLEEWQNNPADIPKKNSLELDKLVTWTDVTKKNSIEEVEGLSRDGAYIIGLSVQGARWDTNSGILERSKPKEMFCKMPVINVKAFAADKVDVSQGIYTKAPSGKWVLSGVALIMD